MSAVAGSREGAEGTIGLGVNRPRSQVGGVLVDLVFTRGGLMRWLVFCGRRPGWSVPVGESPPKGELEEGTRTVRGLPERQGADLG